MDSSIPHRERLNAELRVLRAFCRQPTAPPKSLLARLNSYPWVEPDHEVVYRALRAAAEANIVVTQELLSGFATRAGFPDLDWEKYFSQAAADSADPSIAMEALLAGPS
jgi:hypothetical protein